MESLNDKNCLIFGFGISGKGVCETLKRLNANIFVFDEDKTKCQENGVLFVRKITKKLIKDMDLIILSPNIKLTKKEQRIIKKFKVDCIGEIEFGYMLSKGNIIAVTGSNGKTTTVTLIKEMLDTKPCKNYLLGNIGTSFSKFALEIEKDDNVVLELSSFQLMQTKQFRPHIACLLNLAPDHLDFHSSLEEYYNSKFKIFENQKENDIAILNYDDELCLERSKNLHSQVYYFSTKTHCKGMFIDNGTIYFSDGIITYPIEKLENIRYLGEHNLSNYLCASLTALLSGVSLENISYILNNFNTPPHRIEFVRRLRNVDYYNDSKATNIASCITACKAFDKNIHLLIGGSDKGENFKNLLNGIPINVKYVYLYGSASKKIYKQLRKSRTFTTYKCETLKNAINFSHLKAKKGEVILLSPACASFDTFNNFEERGHYFKDLVNNLE